MKKHAYLLFILAASIAGCQKEISSDLKNDALTTSEESNSVAVDTYLPLTAGTYWNYSVINDQGTAKPSKFTVLNYKKNISGKVYTGVKTVTDGDVSNADTSYYNQTQNTYTIARYQQVDKGSGSQIEFIFLKDAPVGTKWSESIKAGSQTLKMTGKVLQRDLTLTVGGKTYKNVIHSYVEIKKQILFTGITIAKQDFYVAKNIGIIKNVSKVVFPSTSTITTSVKDYIIK